jgi:LPS export ABC transporter protein LptC
MTSGLSNGSLTKILTGFIYSSLTNRINLVPFVVTLLVSACNTNDLKEPLEYTGPVRKAENIELYYTEKDRVKVKMVAAELHEFIGGDREFPKGIYLEFYDEFGKMESTLRANHAYFTKKENLWRGRGKVEVRNIAKKEQLNTEELFWKQTEERIYTDKFVTIRMQGDVIYGEGLEANQDMSEYVIKKPVGEFEVQE